MFAFALILIGIMLILTIYNPLNEYISILIKKVPVENSNPKYHDDDENQNNEDSGMLTNN